MMTQARQALREGRFYRAGRQYELASMTRPRNPLAFVGRGLSSFGAGEYHSAALSIRRALELFPALMETQLDIGSLLPVKDFDIDTQMNEIEEWLTDSKADGAVRFLAAFLYKNMGRDELAKHHAEVLLEGKKASDPIYAAYAQYVLTGKKPADLEGKAPQLKESQPR
jgi:Flp pilus assembly protein TadD